jgi:pimeloyl-ACP methyl ester carboxylesterase
LARLPELIVKREAQRRDLEVQGIHLSYLEWGCPQAGRPSVLILHGLLAAAETFDHVAEALDPTLHILAVDLPANGHSEPDPHIDTTTQGLASILREFMSLTGLDRPVILGHSHGGLLAMRLAATEPEAVRGLVLMAPAHPFNGYRESMVQFYLRPFGRTCARLIFPRIPARFYLYFFHQMPGTRDHFNLEVLEPYLHSLRQGGCVPYTLNVLKSWHDDMETLKADLHRSPLRMPTLVLWGGQDHVVPVSTAPELLACMLSAEFVQLPLAGHLPNEEAPQEVAALVQPWFDRNFALDDLT